MKCVEVCPNRANTLVRVGDSAAGPSAGHASEFRDEAQIVHLDSFCNECGNCATFCPWEGKPYRDKLTVFASEEDFRDSANPGFFLLEGAGLARLGGRIVDILFDAAGNVLGLPDDLLARSLVTAIARDHRYLLGGLQ
jgi:putative selenate reductase